MTSIATALSSALSPASAQAVVSGPPGMAPGFDDVLASLGEIARPPAPCGLPLPDPARATAYDATGVLAAGPLAPGGNPAGARALGDHRGKPLGDEAQSRAAMQPATSATSRIDPDPELPSCGIARIDDAASIAAPAPRAGAPMGDATDAVLAGAPPQPMGVFAPADALDTAGARATAGCAAPRPVRVDPAGAGLIVATDQADAAASLVSVSTRGPALDDIATDALADAVRALLARHGLVLGSLKVNARPASGGSDGRQT